MGGRPPVDADRIREFLAALGRRYHGEGRIYLVGGTTMPAATERARHIGQYGGLLILHFDPYSTALSKVSRGREEDFRDVLLLLEAGFVDWEELRRLFAMVLPRMELESLKADPDEFRGHFEVLARMWRGTRPESEDA